MIKSVYQTIYTGYTDKTVHRSIEIEVTHLLKESAEASAGNELQNRAEFCGEAAPE